MANGSAAIQVNTKLAEAYNAAPKTTQKKLQALWQEALRATTASEKPAQRLSKKETDLFLRINCTLPEAEQQRFADLTEKRLAGKLSTVEHKELEQLILAWERLGADQLQAVIELARLRKIPPEQMLKQLELDALV